MSLVVLSTERVASLPSKLAATKSVDTTLSQLASGLPVVPTSVSKAPSTPLSSRSRMAEKQSIDLVLADDELLDSLRTIANDLLESTLR